MRSGLSAGFVSIAVAACAASTPRREPTASAPAPTSDPAQPAVCAPAKTTPNLPYAPPRPRRPNACTTAQIREYVRTCLAPLPNKNEGCDTFHAMNVACFACLDATPESPDRGPVIRYPGFFDINIGGCIASTRRDGPDGCGRAFQLTYECRVQLCLPSCPVKNRTTLASYDACRDAVTDECATYDADHVKRCNGTFVKGDAAAVCTPAFETEDAEVRVQRVAEYFCGKPS
jgi:hypothetical protein